jgi:hypothetical protein
MYDDYIDMVPYLYIQDNEYLKTWTDEQKMNLVTPIGYKRDY